MSDDVKIPLPRSLQEIVGSLLFASESPLTATELRDSIRAVEAEEGENKEIMDVYKTCTNKEIDQALRGLEKALEVAGAGFKLVCTGGTYRLQTTPSCGRYVRAMLKLDRPNRLGRASLETLAIIAYRQPLTKSEIEEIRGVDVSANIKTLMDLQLIRLVGKSELPGHPFLYGTTPLFLDHFGLASLQQLNDLDPTLQRSNPKEKAASYKKKVEEKKVEEKEEGQEAEVKVEGEEPNAETEGRESEVESREEDPNADPEGRESEVESREEELLDDAAGETHRGTESDAAATDDDDIFIDDTPDEFDDEDEEDDDEEDEDEELDEDEEDEDEEDDDDDDEES